VTVGLPKKKAGSSARFFRVTRSPLGEKIIGREGDRVISRALGGIRKRGETREIPHPDRPRTKRDGSGDFKQKTDQNLSRIRGKGLRRGELGAVWLR